MEKERPLYLISTVAKMLNIHPQTLRLYEREGLIKPARTEGNTRLYSQEDIERLRTILTLTRELGVNLAGVEIILRLREQIEQYLLPKAEKFRAISAMCPHAGYMYSGAVAGAVYSYLVIPQKVVLIGPNHTGMGASASIMTQGTWLTPLGEVEIDQALSSKILANSRHLEDDAQAHLAEHSLEVQLPFLQYFRPEVTIVPIVLMGHSYELAQDVGQAIAQAIKEEDVLIISSSDMSHYEPQEIAAEKDKSAIEAILNLDPQSLYNTVVKKKISMCGVIPTVATLTASLLLGAQEARLIGYMTSGDITGDYSQVVGYAGIILY